ncbi:hypothetical protein GCM10009555_061690 [Acrocarpospora macrocephala]|uniref:YCII-related domain-containing protein n=1 Tax=Acrocarpospora macrocephala TaxID=150177 RepID=A0A5M3WND4_9ACTN|nr:YciI family protein [Acrocarpospora macrocephala]GES09612.1 hypothetical protein Amac_032080 [Acrocarpospora macrocephala]
MIRAERVYVVELRPTPARYEKSAEFERILPAHLDWVARRQHDGVLLATGPFVDEETGQNTGHGLFLFRLPTAAEVAAVVAEDPQVIGGFKEPEIRPWLMRTIL